MKILIADDDADIRESVSLILTSCGHSCDTVADGKECLKQLVHETYDLLILDLVMPEMDGEQVMLAARGRFPGTDFVVFSAQDDEQIIKEMLDLGAIAYIVKPVEPNAYVDLVQKIDADRAKRSTEAGISPRVLKSQHVL